MGKKALINLLLLYVMIINSIGVSKVAGTSMEPTLRDGSFVLINKLSSHLRRPRYGDVVVISQKEKGYSITKRVIGVPGDTVMIEDGTVYVNGSPLPEIYTLGKSGEMNPVRVVEETIFVLGDNRDPGESLDSRSTEMGLIKTKDVKGYGFVSLYPFYKIMKPLKI